MTRRAVLAATAATAGLIAVTGCTDEDGRARGAEAPLDTQTPPEPPTLVLAAVQASLHLGGDAAELAAAVSTTLLTSSRVAVLAPDEPSQLATAASLASSGRWPVLIGEPGTELPAATGEALRRLEVEHLVVVVPGDGKRTAPAAPGSSGTTPTGSGASAAITILGAEDLAVHAVAASPTARPPEGVPMGEAPTQAGPHVVVGSGAAGAAAAATAKALGAQAHTEVDDPRDEPAVFAALREDSDLPLVSLAADATAAERLLVQATMAQRAPELPGGGVTCFPHRRMVALYGHPGAPVLGLLGEQGIEGSIRRVGEYVDRYTPLVDETVVPSWEIIASVATGAAGDDGNYSKVWEVEKFRPWVDAAREAGIYVVLDLQPGRSDFLTQAKEYEQLLLEPHVGLALDPEWRLGPNERHLVRIGHVEAAEINSVSDWLATLVRENDLPQKVLTLHQFRLSMIRDRDQVRTDHPEIAVVLHADGQGGQGAKQDTWRVLKGDLPNGMWLGWKNFYDEDSPMLTPEQTIAQVDPTPWFISYQ